MGGFVVPPDGCFVSGGRAALQQAIDNLAVTPDNVTLDISFTDGIRMPARPSGLNGRRIERCIRTA